MCLVGDCTNELRGSAGIGFAEQSWTDVFDEVDCTETSLWCAYVEGSSYKEERPNATQTHGIIACEVVFIFVW